MWREMAADDRIEVNVDGFKVVAYSFGSSTETVFCLNGGPGLACDYLRESHSCLVDQGYRVVAFDQLGTGASDRPTDTSLWTIARYVEET
ncbi:MAG: proline iminopeptidase, partial [Mesorhizobium sp.]